MSLPIVGYTVLGHDDQDGPAAPLFDSVPDAERFVEVYGGDVYPVVDVEIVEVDE